jgi:hypothetical protein
VWSSVVGEADSFSSGHQIYRIFVNRRFIIVWQVPPLVAVLSQMNPVNIIPSTYFKDPF